MTTDFAGMSDEDLNAAIEAEAEDSTPDTAPDSVDAAAGQTPVTEDAQEPREEEATDEQATDGEGKPLDKKFVDLRALQEERELRKQERDRAAALEAELARYRQQEADALARQQDATIQANYEQILIEHGEEAAAQYIQQLTKERESAVAAEYAQRETVNKLALSEELVKEVHPDYDTRFNRIREVLGDEGTLAVINRALSENPRNPAKWIHEYSKANFPTDADRKAAIDAEVERRIAELQGKHKPPANRGHQSIGHLSSGTQTPGANKPVRRMSDAELERSLLE